ncbi:MAG TPA: hypothetical protein VMU29_06845 [Smithella sp.]|nr:hypothetical protein [Smithella sp.]
MRSYHKTALTFTMTVIFILLFSPFSFAQYEDVRGVRFKDGGTVYGTIVEMTSDRVIIMDKDNNAVMRKTEDIASLIKEDDLNGSKHSFSLGAEISYIKYEEPDSPSIEEKGMMYGIVGSYTYRDKVMIKLEGKFAYGQVDYNGATWDGTPLAISDIPDYMLEFRWLLGYDFVAKGITITPDFGIGYRYLQDNSQQRDPGGYQRESNYIYIPIGVGASANAGGGWSFGANAEYDLFLWGRQISYFSNIDPYYNNPENEQLRGYGIRGSVSIAKKGEKMGFIIEPYVRYWNIKESDYSILAYDKTPDVYVYEPNNDSTEIGCRLAVTF